MEGEGEGAADEEADVGRPFSSGGVEAGGEEEGDSGGCADPVLESEVEELVVGIAWGIEVTLKADEDGVEGAHAVAPEIEEVPEDSPDEEAEVIGGVVGDEGGPGEGASGGPEGTALGAAVG